MLFCSVVKLFKSGNVTVDGLRGTGKDTLIGNVIHRRKYPYVSNLDYGENKIKHIVRQKLKISDLDINNTYKNFINDNVNDYKYPYLKYADIYISDGGIYLPSQYCNQLNKEYEGIVSFQALSRQIAECNIHFNVQNLNRVWDKVREQSDIYIKCNWCKFLFGKIVIQKITIYDKYSSCQDKIKPCKINVPLFANNERKEKARMYLDDFKNKYGSIRSHLLIYKNKSKHNTLYFGDILSKNFN